MNYILWILIAIIVVAVVVYLIGKRGKTKGGAAEEPSETPPTEGPEV